MKIVANQTGIRKYLIDIPQFHYDSMVHGKLKYVRFEVTSFNARSERGTTDPMLRNIHFTVYLK